MNDERRHKIQWLIGEIGNTIQLVRTTHQTMSMMIKEHPSCGDIAIIKKRIMYLKKAEKSLDKAKGLLSGIYSIRG